MFSPTIKRSAGTILNRLGLLHTYAFLKRKGIGSQVTIMWYHRISPTRDDWSLEALSPKSFERQIVYLCRTCQILPLGKLMACLREGKSLPDRVAAITIDDGYKDNYLYAYPILRKFQVPATIFLTTGHIGTPNLFWWDKVGYLIQHTSVERLRLGEHYSYRLESPTKRRYAHLSITEKLKDLPDAQKNLIIEDLVNVAGVHIPYSVGQQLILSWTEVSEMSRNGVDFGAHTVTHPILTMTPPEEARREIAQSREDIEARVGKPVRLFSYPNGDFNAEIEGIVKELGFLAAFTCDPVWISSKSNFYELGRIGGPEDFDMFKLQWSGLWGDLRTALGSGE